MSNEIPAWLLMAGGAALVICLGRIIIGLIIFWAFNHD